MLCKKWHEKNDSFKMHLSAFLFKVISNAISDRALHVNIYELNV